MEDRSCPLCAGGPAMVVVDSEFRRVAQCIRCGTFTLTGTMLAFCRNSDAELRDQLPYLSAFTRQHHERGERAHIDEYSWRRHAQAHRTPVMVKLMKVLAYLERASTHLGEEIEVAGNDNYPLFDARRQDVRFLLDTLEEMRAVRRDREHDGRWSITAEGLARLHPTTAGGEPGTCFVAMAFASELDPAFDDGIAPAVQDCALRLVRTDRVEDNGIVNDLMLGEIRGCEVLVADVTNQRNGVYFEAGFALGLGKVVIWSCRADDLDNVHFDTRQYGHVVWQDPADLREKLRNRIRATVASARNEAAI